MPANKADLSTSAKKSAEIAKLPDDTMLEPADLEALGVAAVSTLANWRSREMGPRFVMLGGGPRYLVRDLRQWIDSGGVRGALHHQAAA